MEKNRSNLWPFSPTKACEVPPYLDFKKSFLFSEQQFLSLLNPHTPFPLGSDFSLFPVSKVVWFFNFRWLDIHPYLLHGNGFKFENTFSNCVYALLYRVLAVPDNSFPSFISYSLEWFSVQKVRFDHNLHLTEWIANLKSHQRPRCLRALQDMKYSVFLPKTLDVFPKGDELLLMKAKPRIIWNVPPVYQALLGPVFRQVTFSMKEQFDGKRVYKNGSQSFTLMFACGLVSSDLDAWVQHSLALLHSRLIDWAAIFLGDDSFILSWRGGKVVGIENDFSAFDSTQRTAAQQRTLKMYSLLGLPPYVLDACWAVSNMRLRVRYGPERTMSFKIGLSTPQTATGKPDTCVGNTLINMDATVHFMNGGDYADYGFVAKTKISDPWFLGTFLKGYWCWSLEGGYAWN